MKNLIDEFKSLMEAGLNELPDYEVASEYFGDACYVLNQIEDEQVVKKLENLYMVNPRDFAY